MQYSAYWKTVKETFGSAPEWDLAFLPQKTGITFPENQIRPYKESDIFLNYTYENGFLGVGCTINAIYEDNGGIVWVGGNDRLTACHPLVTETTFDSIAPNIQLTGVSLYNESIEWSNLEQHQDSALKLGNGVTIKNFAFDSISRWYSVPHNLSLAYSNNYVAFNYVGITMNQPKKLNINTSWKAMMNNGAL